MSHDREHTASSWGRELALEESTNLVENLLLLPWNVFFWYMCSMYGCTYPTAFFFFYLPHQPRVNLIPLCRWFQIFEASPPPSPALTCSIFSASLMGPDACCPPGHSLWESLVLMKMCLLKWVNQTSYTPYLLSLFFFHFFPTSVYKLYVIPPIMSCSMLGKIRGRI